MVPPSLWVMCLCCCRYWLSVGAAPTVSVHRLLGLVRGRLLRVPHYLLCCSRIGNYCDWCGSGQSSSHSIIFSPFRFRKICNSICMVCVQAGLTPKHPRLYLEAARCRYAMGIKMRDEKEKAEDTDSHSNSSSEDDST